MGVKKKIRSFFRWIGKKTRLLKTRYYLVKVNRDTGKEDYYVIKKTSVKPLKKQKLKETLEKSKPKDNEEDSGRKGQITKIEIVYVGRNYPYFLYS